MEHSYTSEITCPYCNYEFRDSWERDIENGEEANVVCGSCEKEFNCIKEIEVTYSTSKILCKEGEHKYKLDSHFESKYKYIVPNQQRILKSESDWKWYRIEICEKCDDKEYVEITQEQYNKETKDEN